MAIEAIIGFINTTKPDKARAFYQDVLELRFVADEPYALIFECEGVMLRVAKAPQFEPLPFTILGFTVGDIAVEATRLQKHGVVFERYSFLEQDALGIWSAPGGAKVAWFKDPDGNLLSLTQHGTATVPTRDRVIPEIIAHDGIAALEFYKKAFFAVEHARMMAPDGKRLMHGELTIFGHKVFVVSEFDASEGGTCRSPKTLGGTGVRMTLTVDDADATVARAVELGATVLMPVQEMFWGARYGKLRDPFGHEWGINQQLRKMTEAETDKAAHEFFDKKR